MKAICSWLVAAGMVGAVSGLPSGWGQDAAAAKPATNVAAARPIKRVDPVYPGTARAQYVQGTVELTATVAADGAVKDVKVTSGNPIFTKAATDAIAQWKYEPYRVEGVAAESSTTISVDFVLASGVPHITEEVHDPGLPAGGMAGGNGMGAAGKPHLPPPPAGVLRISGRVMAGQLEKRVEPVYPADSVAVDARGDVVLLATIAKTGEVNDVQVVSGPDRFRDAAMEAVKQWRYKPYLVEGEPVDVQTTIALNFSPPPR